MSTANDETRRAGHHTSELSPVYMALRIAAIYLVLGAAWILFSDRLLAALNLPIGVEETIASIKGAGYAIVTSVILYFLAYSTLTRLKQAQDATRSQDLDIRRAYSEAMSTVTGGHFVLLTSEELEAALGTPVTQERPVNELSEMSAARTFIRNAITGLLRTSDIDMVMCAVGEALTNACKHGGATRYQVFLHDNLVQVLVADNGPGIDFRALPRAALVQGYSTSDTLGAGFTVMLAVAERMLIETGATGTTVVLEFT